MTAAVEAGVACADEAIAAAEQEVAAQQQEAAAAANSLVMSCILSICKLVHELADEEDA